MRVPLPLLLAVAAAVAPNANRAIRRRTKVVPPNTDAAGIPKPAITIQRAAKTYDIAYSTLRQWIREGRLPAYKIASGRQVRVYIEDLEALFVPVHGDD